MSPPVRIAWGLAGMTALMGLAWLLSNNRRKFPWRVAIWGVLLQIIFAAIILWTPPGRAVFDFARIVIAKILMFTDAGAKFLWGWLYETTPWGSYAVYDARAGAFSGPGIIFALHVLMTIIFFASLMGILYHVGVMQWIVAVIAKVMRRFLRTSGAETLSVSANIFVGQTEAPLVVRPYVERMTMSELMAVMTGGFATVAGGVMAAYVRFGVDAGHLLAASVMSAPAALVMAKIMFPETETPATAGEVKVAFEKTSANVVDAAASGAADGLKLALNVGAMLLAFLALIAVADWLLGLLDQAIVRIRDTLNGSAPAPEPLGLSLRTILGWIFSVFALIMGIPKEEMFAVGSLLGTKIALNEFVAYSDLAAKRQAISPRSFDIATYALCGFANFGSNAIQIGGISAIAPSRRANLAKLGLRAMIAGALASWQTAAIAGMFIAPEDSAGRLAQFRAGLVAQARDFQAEMDDHRRIAEDYPHSEFGRLARQRLPALRTEFLQYYADVVRSVRDMNADGAERLLAELVIQTEPDEDRRNALREQFRAAPENFLRAHRSDLEEIAATDWKRSVLRAGRLALLDALIERTISEPRYQAFEEYRKTGQWARIAHEFLPDIPEAESKPPEEQQALVEKQSLPTRIEEARGLRDLVRMNDSNEIQRRSSEILPWLEEFLRKGRQK